MPEPFSEVNYEEFVLIVQPGAHGEPVRFTIVADKSLVGIITIQFLQSARLFITSEVMQC
jgi:hypothetical protein